MKKHTDVLLNVVNCPFVTLIESRVPNIWFHEKTDYLFCLTSKGFKLIEGNKKYLEKQNLL